DIVEFWNDEGIINYLLDTRRYAELEPAVSPVWGIPYHLPGCAQVRNPWHMRALITACERVGARLHSHIEVANNFGTFDTLVTGLHVTRAPTDSTNPLPEGVFHADRFLIAAGAWSADHLDFLGKHATPPYEPSDYITLDTEQGASWVHPVRGQIVLLKTE